MTTNALFAMLFSLSTGIAAGAWLTATKHYTVVGVILCTMIAVALVVSVLEWKSCRSKHNVE